RTWTTPSTKWSTPPGCVGACSTSRPGTTPALSRGSTLARATSLTASPCTCSVVACSKHRSSSTRPGRATTLTTSGLLGRMAAPAAISTNPSTFERAGTCPRQRNSLPRCWAPNTTRGGPRCSRPSPRRIQRISDAASPPSPPEHRTPCQGLHKPGRGYSLISSARETPPGSHDEHHPDRQPERHLHLHPGRQGHHEGQQGVLHSRNHLRPGNRQVPQEPQRRREGYRQVPGHDRGHRNPRSLTTTTEVPHTGHLPP